MKLREWNAHLHGLVVFRTLLNDPVVAKLLDLTDRMEAGCSSYGPVCDAVAAFEAALRRCGSGHCTGTRRPSSKVKT